MNLKNKNVVTSTQWTGKLRLPEWCRRSIRLCIAAKITKLEGEAILYGEVYNCNSIVQ